MEKELWISKFNFYKSTRVRWTCDGVGINVKNLLYKQRYWWYLQNIWRQCKLLTVNMNLNFALIYSPPYIKSHKSIEQLGKIKTSLQDLISSESNTILLRDLNLPNVRWKWIANNVSTEYFSRRNADEYDLYIIWKLKPWPLSRACYTQSIKT